MTPKTDTAAYIIRKATAADRNFIFATWLRGLYYGDTWFNRISKPIFMENYHKIIERLIDNPNTVVRVACLADDNDVILGYSVSRILNFGNNVAVVDWVFVKSAWRKIGIGKKLLPDQARACTHLTTLGNDIIKTKMPEIIFNPFVI